MPLALCTLVFALWVVPSGWMRHGPVAGAALAAPVLLALVFLIASMVRTRVVVTPAQLIAQDGLRRRRWPREHIARLLRAEVTYEFTANHDILFVLDGSGARLFTLDTSLYPTRDIDRLADALAVPCSGPKGPIAVSELVELHPGIPTRAQRDPTLFPYLEGMLLPMAISLVWVALWLFL